MPKFQQDIYIPKFQNQDNYLSITPKLGFFTNNFPTLSFFSKLFFGPFIWLCRRAAKGLCDDYAWVYGSVWVSQLIEDTGCQIEINGLEYITKVNGPCIIIANHMSTLETFMLPGIIQPRKPVTFVVKKSLVTMPFFGAVMRSRNPVVVGRTNPKEDLLTVFEHGTKLLQKGISIIIFPQSTRTLHFDPKHFNSIGVKLAKKANVPIIPLALKTDAWGKGNKIKELGKVKIQPIRYQFSEPIYVENSGKEEHIKISNFIEKKLKEWQEKDGINE